MSTKVLAAGCTTSSSFMMVAPSLEIVVLPAHSFVRLCMCLYVRVRVCVQKMTRYWVLVGTQFKSVT